MSGSASAWTSVALAEVCLPALRRDPRRDGEGAFQYVDINAVDNRRLAITLPKLINNQQAPSRARHEIRQGDVLVSLVRPYLRNIARVPSELDGQIASSAFCVLRPSPLVSTDYLFYAVQRRQFMQSITTYGESPPAARDDEFMQLGIPLPPLREQHRIVADIERRHSMLDRAMVSLTSVLQRFERYTASVMATALRPSSALASEHWESVSLGDLASRITSGSRAWRQHIGRGNGRFLLAGAVHAGHLRLVNAPPIDAPGGAEADRTRVAEGDLLVTIVGDVGRATAIRQDIGEAYVSQSVALIRTDARVSAKYLEIHFRSPSHGQRYIREKQYGIGRGHLLLSHLRDMPVSIPSVPTQERIVAAVDEQESVVEKTKQATIENVSRCAGLRELVLDRGVLGVEAGDRLDQDLPA